MAEITLDDVKKRAAIAGLTMRPDRIEMVRKLLAEALQPLAQTDSRTIKTLEPATTFDATGGRDGK